MSRCLQTEGLTILEHGHQVHNSYIQLIDDLENGLYPELHQLYTALKAHLPPAKVLANYHILHDCGKHLCLYTDENGRRHFPDHATWSAKQHAIIFPEDGFTTALIRHDMDFHMMRGDDLKKLCRNPLAPILYFTAWAEINANAEMFGGKNSESYKIKRSRLIQAGKKFLTKE